MNRKIRFGLILPAVLSLAGCAAGQMLGPLPVVEPTTAATIVVVRPYNFFGSGRAPSIFVDGVEVCDIGPGEHVAISVPPGEHLIGMLIVDLVNLRQSVRIKAEPKQSYYVVLSPGPTFAELAEAEGEALVAKTTAVGERYRERERAAAPR